MAALPVDGLFQSDQPMQTLTKIAVHRRDLLLTMATCAMLLEHSAPKYIRLRMKVFCGNFSDLVPQFTFHVSDKLAVIEV